MFRNVFTKTLYSLRWQTAGWALALMFVAFITMMVYPSFSGNGVEDIVNSVPKEFQSLVGDVSDFKTIPGFIGQQVFGPNLYILSLVMTILIFMAVSANEESDGRLQVLLSFPVSRSKVYIQKWLAACLVVATISASVFVATWLALIIIKEDADIYRLLLSTLAFVLINLVYGMIGYAAAFFTGNKSLTLIIVCTYTVISFLITSLAPAVDKLQTIDYISLLHYYNNPQIMSNGLDIKHLAVLVSAFAALTVIGWIGFLRRDVRTN